MVPKSRQAKMIRQFRVDNSDLYITVKARGGWISLLKLENGNTKSRWHFKMLSKEAISYFLFISYSDYFSKSDTAVQPSSYPILKVDSIRYFKKRKNINGITYLEMKGLHSWRKLLIYSPDHKIYWLLDIFSI